jgi:hypothetical protein
MDANVLRPEDAQVLPPGLGKGPADPAQLAMFSTAAKVDLRGL